MFLKGEVEDRLFFLVETFKSISIVEHMLRGYISSLSTSNSLDLNWLMMVSVLDDTVKLTAFDTLYTGLFLSNLGSHRFIITFKI